MARAASYSSNRANFWPPAIVLSIVLTFGGFTQAAPVQCIQLIERIHLQNEPKYETKPDWIEKTLKLSEIENIDHIRSIRANNEAQGFRLIDNLPRDGFHLGLGGDFNYTVIGNAKSSGGLIYDFDPNIIMFHHMVRAAMLMSSTPRDFASFFKDLQTHGLNVAQFQNFKQQLPSNFPNRHIVDFVRNSHLAEYFVEVSASKDSTGRLYTYLGSQSVYQTVRSAFQADRIHFALRSQYDPHVFRDLVRQHIAEKFSTIYVSNSLEYRWLSGDELDPEQFKMARRFVEMDSSPEADLYAVIPTLEKLSTRAAFLKDTLKKRILTDIEKNEVSEIFIALHGTIIPRYVIKHTMPSWNQFWANINELSIRPDAVLLSTNRESSIFGQVFKELNIKPSDEPDYKWCYARIPRHFWTVNGLPSAIQNSLNRSLILSTQIATDLISILPPDLSRTVQDNFDHFVAP